MKGKYMVKKTVTIAVDAMGGDQAPRITVEGACKATEEMDVRLILVGDEKKIRTELQKHNYDKEKIRLLHTAEEINMRESPRRAIQEKPGASVLLTAKLLAEGKAEAMISAGSTGAVVLAAAEHLQRIPGVKRTALGTIFPTLNVLKRPDIFSLILDMGANVSNSPEDLVHFAYMGMSYKQKIMGVPSPRVALLNIGAEEKKGNAEMRKAYQLLSGRPDIDFIGNIEGNELSSGKADVVVAEGMQGNIAIKTMEGTAEAVKKLGKMAYEGKCLWKLGLLCLSGGIKKIMKVASYEEYGGALLFGFDKIVIKSHGRSTAHAFMNGIKVAVRSVQDDLVPVMRESIRQFETDMKP